MASTSSLDLAAILAAQDAELAAQTVEHDGVVYTVGQLKAAFERCLRPGQNWKDAIHMIAESQEEARLLEAAINFHVGGPTTITTRECNYRGGKITVLILDNQGYYVNIGA
jgi:hypothetical protein